MRLIINNNNSYTWTILLGKKYLFSKHISKYSIEAYKKLCKGIKITFKTLLVIVEQILADCLQEKILIIYICNIEV